MSITTNNRRTLYLSSDRKNNKSTDYNICIDVPDLRNYNLKKVALISASIQNNFLTIQANDTNNYFTMYYLIAMRDGQDFGGVWGNVRYEIPEGYYNEKQLLDKINELVKATTLEDINIQNRNQGTVLDKYKNLKVFERDEQPFYYVKGDTSNCLHFGNHQYIDYTNSNPQFGQYVMIQEIRIIMNNLSFRLFGGKEADQDLQLSCSINMSDIVFDYTFPYVNTLQWVSALQIRFSFINGTEDSKVLYQIPIRDFTQPYISFVNPEIIASAKPLAGTLHYMVEIQITNQDGYEINLRDVVFNLDILLF